MPGATLFAPRSLQVRQQVSHTSRRAQPLLVLFWGVSRVILQRNYRHSTELRSALGALQKKTAGHLFTVALAYPAAILYKNIYEVSGEPLGFWAARAAHGRLDAPGLPNNQLAGRYGLFHVFVMKNKKIHVLT